MKLKTSVLLAAAVLLSRWRDCGGQRGFSFFFLSLLCFFSFLFSPFSLLGSLLSCVLSSLSFSPSVLLLLSCSPFPCFYRQKTRERENRAATVLPPLQHMKSFGLCRRLFKGESTSFWRGRWRWQRKKKSSSSPVSRVQGKKKTHSAI